MKHISTTTLLLFLALAATAQWNPDPAINTPICLSQGKQIDLRMETDGKGGAFIVWKDYRASVPDIYMQRVNAAGVPMWTTDGVPICTDPYDQSTPAIVSDMNGGAIVAWSDWRSGIERDLYAQRVDSNGTILWTFNGVGVANKQEREHNERICSDGAGGAYIIWEQQRTTDFSWDVWLQHINAAGQPVWQVGGLPVAYDNSNRINGKIQADGKGGVFVVWQDLRNGFDYDIYGQHFNAQGNQLWGTTGKAICNSNGTQVNAKIDPDSTIGGIYVAWVDDRLSFVTNDIYAARIDSNGNPLWATNGVPVTTATNNQSAHDIISNRLTDGVIVTWKDNRFGEYDIYAQKLNSSGVPQWTANGIVVCDAMGPQVNPNITTDKAGGAVIVWQDSSMFDWDIRSQRIDASGNILWTSQGEWVCNAPDYQTSPKNVTDGHGGSIYAWQDHRPGQYDIYVHHLYADGLPLVGLDQPVTQGGLHAFPNPFSSALHLQVETDQGPMQEITIQDITGRTLAHIPAQGQDQWLPAEAFPTPGLYIIQVTCQSSTLTTKVLHTPR